MSRFYFGFFAAVLCGVVTSAHANWQYPNQYKRDSWDGDDGMRVVMSVRGGAAYGRAKIQNDIGGLTGEYMYDLSTGEIVTKAYAEHASGSFEPAGYGRLGDLPAAQKYEKMSFVIGVSAGLTVPDVPQWRVEFGYDHITEADYNQNPLFDGKLTLSGGDVVEAQSGGAQSEVSSDVYSVMAYYDFFEGITKPTRTMIPYVGAGVGYADTKTILQLTDSYGDLSYVYELQNFGIIDDSYVIQFNKAETHSSNLVPMAAVGFSYGVNEKMFIDVGVRGMYMSKIKWQLTSQDSEKRRDWFNAEKMLYVTAMLGLRVEF